jgi:hypothetical protein
MLKYTVTAKDNQGKVLSSEKIEGKSAALKTFDLLTQGNAYSVKMTRYLVTTGVTSIEKGWIRK